MNLNLKKNQVNTFQSKILPLQIKEGIVIKDYKLLSLLAKRVSVDVYHAIHIKSSKEFAVKIYYLDKLSEKEYQRLQLEINIMVKLDNEKIVKIEEYYQIQYHSFLFMELCKIDLYNYLLKYEVNFQQDECLFIIQELAKGLISFQDIGCVHRGISLQNIFIGNDNRIKLGDLNFSKYMSDISLNSSIVGIPGSLAPEIIKKKNSFNIQSDVYSLGVILHYLVYKAFPYQANTLEDLERLQEDDKVYDIKEGFELSIELIQKMLEKDPQQRIQLEQLMDISQYQYQDFKFREDLQPNLQQNKQEFEIFLTSKILPLYIPEQLEQLSEVIEGNPFDFDDKSDKDTYNLNSQRGRIKKKSFEENDDPFGLNSNKDSEIGVNQLNSDRNPFSDEPEIENKKQQLSQFSSNQCIDQINEEEETLIQELKKNYEISLQCGEKQFELLKECEVNMMKLQNNQIELQENLDRIKEQMKRDSEIIEKTQEKYNNFGQSITDLNQKASEQKELISNIVLILKEVLEQNSHNQTDKIE